MNHVKYHDYTKGGDRLSMPIDGELVTGIIIGVFVSAVVFLAVWLLS